MIIKAPRGTADILPDSINQWKYVEKITQETAETFGYSEIRTPVFEHTELFERGVGDTTDVVQKEMYTFNDKGDRSITLRPEGTASVARAYLEHSFFALPLPVKLFYSITCYRYEKPQAGRLREFHQFGVEAYGSPEPAVDAEVIALASTIFKNLGINGLSLNINSIGCPECRKKYNEALVSYLSSHSDSLCETCNIRLNKNPMRVLDCKSHVCKGVAEKAPYIIDYICDDCRSHFDKTKTHLDKMGIAYEIDPTIVRGLDYYTKTVFEFVSADIGAQGTVCGGGRYDNLIGLLGGSPTPGIGFALGMERILLVMNAQGISFPTIKKPQIYIASIGQAETATALCHSLRLKGIYAECDLLGRSLKAQMKNADRIGAAFTVVLGDDEVISGIARLKNMADGTVSEININDTEALAALL